MPPLPAPKTESESVDNKETKPDVKELLFSLLDYVKESIESLKKIVFNEKNVSKWNSIIELLFTKNLFLFSGASR